MRLDSVPHSISGPRSMVAHWRGKRRRRRRRHGRGVGCDPRWSKFAPSLGYEGVSQLSV